MDGQDPVAGPASITIDLTPTSAAGQASLEGWIVHMEALGHRVIPWGQLSASERWRLRARVVLMRRRLRTGQRVQIMYGLRPAWSTGRRRPCRRASPPRRVRRPGWRRPRSSRGPPAGGGDDPDDDGDPSEPGLDRAFSRSAPVRVLGRVSAALDALLARIRPEPYSLREHRARYGHLQPDEQLARFLALPQRRQAQAWRALSVDLERGRSPPCDPARLELAGDDPAPR
jgi:hypothetical protein